MKELQEFMEMIYPHNKDKLMRSLDNKMSKELNFKSITWMHDTCLSMNVYFKQYILGVTIDSKLDRIESMNKIKDLSKQLREVLISFRKDWNECKKNNEHKKDESCDK